MINFGVGVILPSAGTGERMGCSTPKQYTRVMEKPLFALALEAFNSCPWVKKIVLVADNPEYAKSLLTGSDLYQDKLVVVRGESTRHRSIRSGIRKLQEHGEDLRIVVVHDAVRPFVPRALVEELVLAADKWGAAGATRPLISTILAADSEGFLQKSLERSRHLASEMPQAFQIDILSTAYNQCSEEDLDHGTECLQLALRYAGVKARLIPGPSDLWKVTYPKDIYTVIGCLKEKTSLVCIIAAEENDSTRLLVESLSKKVARVTFIRDILKETFNIFVVFHVKEITQEFDLTTLPVMDVDKPGLIVHVVQQTSVQMMKNTTVYEVNVSTRNLAQKYNQLCKSVVTIYCHTQDDKSLVNLVTSLVLSDYKTFSGQTFYV